MSIWPELAMHILAQAMAAAELAPAATPEPPAAAPVANTIAAATAPAWKLKLHLLHASPSVHTSHVLQQQFTGIH